MSQPFQPAPLPEIEVIARLLLVWYPCHARDLPWRRTSDPYAIWISEVMLQQTQVQTVIPYWERWMRQFPDLKTLAQSQPERILKLWEGLGYYTRARHLHRAARQILDEHGGCFPTKFQAVLALPGVGRYTAGAICSIAFNQATPILDGNVVRVLTRVFQISGNVRQGNVRNRLWRLSENLVKSAAQLSANRGRTCSQLNQALMELGATVCRAKNPDCDRCPIVRSCGAHRTGRVDHLPKAGNRPRISRRRFAAFATSFKGRILLRQRPEGVVNAGLWEFPNVETTGTSIPIGQLAAKCLGCPAKSVAPLCTIHHSITRYRIQLDVYRVDLRRRPSPTPLNSAWIPSRQLENLAFPSAHRKIIAALEKSGTLCGNNNRPETG